jgi:hypothetical protein
MQIDICDISRKQLICKDLCQTDGLVLEAALDAGSIRPQPEAGGLKIREPNCGYRHSIQCFECSE